MVYLRLYIIHLSMASGSLQTEHGTDIVPLPQGSERTTIRIEWIAIRSIWSKWDQYQRCPNQSEVL